MDLDKLHFCNALHEQIMEISSILDRIDKHLYFAKEPSFHKGTKVKVIRPEWNWETGRIEQYKGVITAGGTNQVKLDNGKVYTLKQLLPDDGLDVNLTISVNVNGAEFARPITVIPSLEILKILRDSINTNHNKLQQVFKDL